MERIRMLVGLELVKVGVTGATIKVIPGDDGGVVVRVARLADIDRAELAAKAIGAAIGWEVLIAF